MCIQTHTASVVIHTFGKIIINLIDKTVTDKIIIRELHSTVGIIPRTTLVVGEIVAPLLSCLMVVARYKRIGYQDNSKFSIFATRDRHLDHSFRKRTGAAGRKLGISSALVHFLSAAKLGWSALLERLTDYDLKFQRPPPRSDGGKALRFTPLPPFLILLDSSCWAVAAVAAFASGDPMAVERERLFCQSRPVHWTKTGEDAARLKEMVNVHILVLARVTEEERGNQPTNLMTTTQHSFFAGSFTGWWCHGNIITGCQRLQQWRRRFIL